MENVRTVTALYIGGRWLPAGSPVPLVEGFNYEKAARKGQIEHAEGEEIVNPAPEGTLTAQLESAPDPKGAAELERRAQELESQVTTLTSERDSLRRSLETTAGQVAEAQARAAEAEAQLRAAQAERDAAQAALAEGKLIPGDALQRIVDVKGVGEKLAPAILEALIAPAQAE